MSSGSGGAAIAAKTCSDLLTADEASTFLGVAATLDTNPTTMSCGYTSSGTSAAVSLLISTGAGNASQLQAVMQGVAGKDAKVTQVSGIGDAAVETYIGGLLQLGFIKGGNSYLFSTGSPDSVGSVVSKLEDLARGIAAKV